MMNKIIKEYCKCKGQVVLVTLRTLDYDARLDKFIRLEREAVRDFSGHVSGIRVVHFGGRRFKRTWGIEFEVMDDTPIPAGYMRIEQAHTTPGAVAAAEQRRGKRRDMGGLIGHRFDGETERDQIFREHLSLVNISGNHLYYIKIAAGVFRPPGADYDARALFDRMDDHTIDYLNRTFPGWSIEPVAVG